MQTQSAVPEIVELFSHAWWVILLRGIAGIVFGLFAFAWPGATLETLMLLFGAYALIDGVFSLFATVGGWRYREDRWLLLLESVIGLWAGIVILRSPGLAAGVLVLFVAVWAMTIGVLRIVAAIRLRKEISGEFWMALSGIASIAFAFMLMLRPALGTLALIWVMAGFALVIGASLVFLGLELRGLRRIA